MATLQEFIDRGMAFFSGDMVAKAELVTATEKAAALEKDLRDALASVTTLTTERDTARTELATANAELGTVKPQLVTANEKITTLEKAAKTVSATAQEITAAQGIPAAQLPTTGASAAATEAQLLEQWNAITDPKARGEFYLKHFSPKFNNKS